MWVDDGSVDDIGVGDLQCSKVGVQRVANEDSARVKDLQELFLDV